MSVYRYSSSALEIEYSFVYILHVCRYALIDIDNIIVTCTPTIFFSPLLVLLFRVLRGFFFYRIEFTRLKVDYPFGRFKEEKPRGYFCLLFYSFQVLV